MWTSNIDRVSAEYYVVITFKVNISIVANSENICSHFS